MMPTRPGKPGLRGLVGMAVLALLAPAAVAAQEPPGADVCRVFGRVLDALSDEPVAGVSVWLESGDEVFLAGQQTSADGSYAIETAVCEPAILRTNMIGYADAAESIAFDADRLIAVTIRLVRAPVAVDPLTVEVDQSVRLRDVGFYARKAWVEASGKDLGQFYDPEEVAGRAASGASVLGIAMGARVRTIYSGTCAPSFYIDGQWFRTPGRAVRMLSYGILPKDIEGIEIYRPIWGSVPEEYRDPISSTCGAIVVWTKRAPPAEAPQIEVELCTPSDHPDGVSFGGIVSDEVTGVHLPASYVTLTVSQYGGDEKDIETIADEEGHYRYCDIGGWPSFLQARYGSITAEPFEVDSTRAAPGYWEVDLKLAVVRTGSVVGVVEGTGSDEVRVSIEETDLEAVPDAEGYFEIHDILPGDYDLVVRRGDDEIARRSVSVRSGATEALTLAPDVP